MNNLRILSANAVRNLRDQVKNSETFRGLYLNTGQQPIIEHENLLKTTIQIAETPPTLETAGRSANDAENAIKIYEYLGPLTRTQASDKRIWATLSHTTFWFYCQSRWPQATSENYILEHWFEKPGGGLGALRRNAISRLWWAAHLTMAPWDYESDLRIFQDVDRSKYTKVLLSQAQIFQDILERKFGSNTHFRICLLDALNNSLPSVTNRDDLSKAVAVRLNLLLKHRQVDAMGLLEMQQTLSEIVRSSAETLQS